MDAERVRELFNYDPETGIIECKISRRKARAGSIAGKLTWHGYLRTEVEGKKYYNHLLAWLFVHGEWPPDEIDHIDRDKTNNRISNLRLATHAQNKRNSPGRRKTLKGAYRRSNGSWRSQLRYDGALLELGTFKTEQEAHEAYKRTAERLYGEFMRV